MEKMYVYFDYFEFINNFWGFGKFRYLYFKIFKIKLRY